LNYFNYFTEVEDTFVRRRAKHLLLSSIDWALIESWKEMGVPLHVVLRGIEKAFDSWKSKPRKRSVKTLLYCQEEVEAQFAEWLESRVGSEVEPGDERDAESVAADEAIASDKVPFSRAAILEHLRSGRAQILATLKSRVETDDLTETLVRAATLLEDLEKEQEETRQPDAQKLEVSLTGIERSLSEALRRRSPADQQAALSAEIKKQLRPYRGQMEASAYEQTFENLLLKRLREQFGVPRLSLFYLGL
jgi:hypothetical protein